MRRAPVRVVLDANVLVSALVFRGGRLSLLRHAWHAALIEPLVSTATAAELVRILAYPRFKLAQPEQDELLADYLPYCRVVEVPAGLEGVPACRDPGDTPYLELLIAGRAKWLVTGDRDVLVLAGRLGGRAIAPGALVDSLFPRAT